MLILLAIAVAFNYPFAWRRYPQAWQRRTQPSAAEKCVIPHSRLVYALSQIDTFVDISEEDLQRIYELAMHDETRAVQAAGSLAAQSTRA